MLSLKIIISNKILSVPAVDGLQDKCVVLLVGYFTLCFGE